MSGNGTGPEVDPTKVPVDPRRRGPDHTWIDNSDPDNPRVLDDRHHPPPTAYDRIVASMCPDGHLRPNRWGLCSRCGARLEQPQLA